MRLEELMTWMESLLTITSPLSLWQIDEPTDKITEQPIEKERETWEPVWKPRSRSFQEEPSYLDYPSSGVYEGPIDETGRAHDVDGEPLDHHVSVYHSGRSMSQLEKPLSIPKSRLMSSILLLISGKPSRESPRSEDKSNWPLQESPAHLDYPSSGVYEGPIDETGRAHDVDGEPLDHHVSVYHSGRSDEPTGKAPEQTKIKTHEQHPSVDLGETITEKAQDLKTRVTGCSKRAQLISTIPAPESTKDISIRLEELMTWMESLLTITSPSITLADPMSQLEKPLNKPKSRLMSTSFYKSNWLSKEPAHLRLSQLRSLRRTIDETGRAHDVDGEPLDHHVSVYHSGRSDEPTGKALNNQNQDS
ncbi:hypothetical protein L596_029389 [Steinernema carpocapsae]|uniref:Uncharacterized protein n=1 Tax=Steinernema carpocapsae TaxID=34508 RepID=A0A4U5LUI2_STECR|nr:hypothetical protein L596_029389 [Steinernema carpocapsae]